MRTKLLKVLAHLKAAKMHLDCARGIWASYRGCGMNANDFESSVVQLRATTDLVKITYANKVFSAMPEAGPFKH